MPPQPSRSPSLRSAVAGTGPDLSPLGVLGFSAQEETIYRLALRNSGTTLPGLAGLASLRVGELREYLVRLAAFGLLDLTDDVVVAHPPQEALARLVNAESRRVQSRSQQLDNVRGLLPSLSADHLASSVPQGEPVTVEVLGDGDVAQLVRSLAASSSGELLWLRPDPWKIPSGSDIDAWVVDLLRSGRRSRAVYSVEVLRKAPDMLRVRAEAGEQVRVLRHVPTRLAVMGGSAALIAERLDVMDDRRLVLRHQSMIAALTLMFEGLWEKAMPVPGLTGQPYEQVGDERLLLDQLAGGAKDEQIARALGLSVRTVRRRIAGLLAVLGAESRFKAGVEAARRGWV
jgi:DNA-binding CsgD family transcriptional regulator